MRSAYAHRMLRLAAGSSCYCRFTLGLTCLVLLSISASAQETDRLIPKEGREEVNTPDAPSELRRTPAGISSTSFEASPRTDTALVYRPQSNARQTFTTSAPQDNGAYSAWVSNANSYANPYVPHISRHALAESIRFGIAGADGESTVYHPLQQGGLFTRAQHALLETFTSQTSGGARIPAFSTFAGAYGAAFLANTWYPDPRASFALQRGSAALGSSLGLNLVQELVPHKYFKALHLPDPRENGRR